MEKLLIALILLNAAGAAVYGLHRARRGENPGMALFFLFLSVLGFVFYFVPRQLQKAFFAVAYDRDSLVKRLSIEKAAEEVDVEKALNVVPVKDAMAVSDNAQKRALLLDQLRKDIKGNYKELLPAEADADSESAHYVAAAKMEVYAIHQKALAQATRRYEADPNDSQAFADMLDALAGLVGSELLSDREQNIYKAKYCAYAHAHLARRPQDAGGDLLPQYLDYLVDLRRPQDAVALWDTRREHLRRERCYMKMMELFYEQGDKAQFERCLSQLQADTSVRLSAQGLQQLRFWLERN